MLCQLSYASRSGRKGHGSLHCNGRTRVNLKKNNMGPALDSNSNHFAVILHRPLRWSVQFL
jgi:hypothetical protein